VRVRNGTYRLPGDGTNFVSRIYVDDLAALVIEGLLNSIEGAWPVADDEPCTSAEIARFSAALSGVAPPASAPEAELHRTRRVDRRVKGDAIRRLLGVSLRYPTYRVGIPAAIAAESQP
jgi:nucleoside-diphosphate-sugar epimerase